MRSLVSGLLVFFFFWAQYEVCQKVNEGNECLVWTMTLVAKGVTGAIDSATAETDYATCLSVHSHPWIGISTVSILILSVSALYGKGYMDRESEYGSRRVS